MSHRPSIVVVSLTNPVKADRSGEAETWSPRAPAVLPPLGGATLEPMGTSPLAAHRSSRGGPPTRATWPPGVLRSGPAEHEDAWGLPQQRQNGAQNPQEVVIKL